MIPCLQYLIAEYLQNNGPQPSFNLSSRFTIHYRVMQSTLGIMKKKGYIQGSADKAQLWAFISFPPREQMKFSRSSRIKKAVTFHAGFNQPNLCAIASLPLVRI